MALELSFACQKTDRTRALFDQRVTVDGCDITYITGGAEEIFQRAFRHQEFDITELSLSTHLLTTSRGESAYIGIPAFVSRAFRHSAIYIRNDRGINTPADLRGRRIGVPDFQQTAGVWVRGLLADEYGVHAREIDWLTGGLEQSGRQVRMPLTTPADLRIAPIDPEQTLSAMLAAGELDAVIAPRAPSCFGRSPQIGRLFADYRQAEAQYYRATGLFPIMHLIGIRRTLVEQHPWLPVNVFMALSKARALALAELPTRDTLNIMHPWIPEEVDEIKTLMGADFWPYGVEANRKDIDALLRYAHADGLISAALPLERIFARSTFDGFKF